MNKSLIEEIEPIKTDFGSDLFNHLSQMDENLIPDFILPNIESLRGIKDVEAFDKLVEEETKYVEIDGKKRPVDFNIKVGFESDCIAYNFREIEHDEKTGNLVPHYTRLVYGIDDKLNFEIPKLRFELSYDPGIAGINEVKFSLVYIDSNNEEFDGEFDNITRMIQAFS